MLRTISSLVIVALVVLAVGSLAFGAVISNFEAPTYTADAEIDGVDGWIRFSGSGTGFVMPSASTGYVPPTYPVLAGEQSFVTGGIYGRGWGSVASDVGQGSTLSWLMRMEFIASSGRMGVYLSENVGIGGGGTPAGIELNQAFFDLYGTGGSTGTGVPFTSQTTYLLEMVVNFTDDQFEGFVTDVTNAGPRTSLGAKAFPDLDAGTVAANGGVVIARNGGSWGWFDDFSITANPGPPTHPGDFDGDGDVDGADFVAWQTSFPKSSGATLAQGDADGDGDVDGADFVVWQTNFPFTPSSAVIPIPEPSSFLLMLLGGITGLGMICHWPSRYLPIHTNPIRMA